MSRCPVQPRTLRSLFAAVVFAGVIALLPGAAAAQVSCADPDNLCTGDPCTITAVEVLSPCVVSFGTRTVIVRGPIRVPNGGTLSMSAGAFELRNGIFGRHFIPTAGDGADVSLTSTTGGILIKGTIDVSARDTPGSITLVSAADVDIERKLRAVAVGGGATASGGNVTVAASAGTISNDGQGQIDVRGANFGKDTPGGAVNLSGNHIVIDAKVRAAGSDGGTVQLVSTSGGNIDIEDSISTKAKYGNGGQIMIGAAGTLTTRKAVDSSGVTGSGVVLISANLANMQRGVKARSKTNGGFVGISALGDLSLGGTIDLRAKLVGGMLGVSSTLGKIDSAAKMSVRANTGGSIFCGAAGPLNVLKSLDARGGDAGGMIQLVGAAVTLGSSGDMSVKADVGGGISILGGSLTVDDGTRLDARGQTAGGEIRFTTVGDMVLAGRYDATGAGPAPKSVIAGVSAGNLSTPASEFIVDPTGCIGMTAGGILDLSGGTFSGVAVTPTCASPSGAFLDGIDTF